MLNNLNQLEQNGHKGHIFIGTVVSNTDDLQAERIKVTIPGIFESADPELLPWCGKRHSGPIANGGPSQGSFGLVPRVGDKVFVEFQDGTASYPLYWTSPITVGQMPAESLVNYPNRYGWKDPAGNVFVTDVTPGQSIIQITHKSGTQLLIADDGTVTISSVANLNLTAAGNVVISGARVDIN